MVLKVVIPLLLQTIFLGDYVEEPEFNEEEFKSMEFSDDTKISSDEETDLNSSKQENLHRCKYYYCTLMPTLIKCKCCKEFKHLLDDNLSVGCTGP